MKTQHKENLRVFGVFVFQFSVFVIFLVSFVIFFVGLVSVAHWLTLPAGEPLEVSLIRSNGNSWQLLVYFCTIGLWGALMFWAPVYFYEELEGGPRKIRLAVVSTFTVVFVVGGGIVTASFNALPDVSMITSDWSFWWFVIYHVIALGWGMVLVLLFGSFTNSY